MFIETPEARLLSPGPSLVCAPDRFYLELNYMGAWVVHDREYREGIWVKDGTFAPKVFGHFKAATYHKEGLEAYVRGDIEEAGKLTGWAYNWTRGNA